ncbi:conserved hypothetical protein [Neospora caninum Liverpool]|uniref:OTU domain-containing protein n=1 Tax=Neospora caninum (strain Liverpool) TaxID=572307 RepID=F0VPA9_NEOCL|nr:conserved hypothetical protein [Neospora caninum Liverpool]CBZ55555.1 conserved hypothetical protein [Neospora caninum Liverpool]|eukprot:XP_003885583.1 conserved hypothetical protein [Neospora caninum Liverpool]
MSDPVDSPTTPASAGPATTEADHKPAAAGGGKADVNRVKTPVPPKTSAGNKPDEKNPAETPVPKETKPEETSDKKKAKKKKYGTAPDEDARRTPFGEDPLIFPYRSLLKSHDTDGDYPDSSDASSDEASDKKKGRRRKSEKDSEEEERKARFGEDPLIFPFRSSVRRHSKNDGDYPDSSDASSDEASDKKKGRRRKSEKDSEEEERKARFVEDPLIFPFRSSVRRHSKKAGGGVGADRSEAQSDEVFDAHGSPTPEEGGEAATLSPRTKTPGTADKKDPDGASSERVEDDAEGPPAKSPRVDAREGLRKSPDLPFIPPVIQQLGFHEPSLAWRVKTASSLGIPASQVGTQPLLSPAPFLGRPVAVHQMAPDGSCFFRALSFALTGSQVFAQAIRNCVVDFLLGSPQLTAEDVWTTQDLREELQRAVGRRGLPLWMAHGSGALKPVRDMTRPDLLELYRKYMSYRRTFATEREVDAAARLFGCRILVYLPSRPETKERAAWLVHSPQGHDDDLAHHMAAIYVVNIGRNHFDVVSRVATPTEAEGV